MTISSGVTYRTEVISSLLRPPEVKQAMSDAQAGRIGREDILPRIEKAAQFVPVGRLALSPQCGFASTLPSNLLGEDAQRRKLELISSVAGEMWG